MTVIEVERRLFEFDEPWVPLQPERDRAYRTYTNWSFALLVEKKPVDAWSREMGQGVVDVIAVGSKELALIEMKDYRRGATVVPEHVADVVARKARDTLAYMAACALTSRGADGDQYRSVLLVPHCVAYLDIEWPPTASTIAHPQIVQRTLLQQKLERAFNNSGISSHVVDTQTRQTWRPKDGQ